MLKKMIAALFILIGIIAVIRYYYFYENVVSSGAEYGFVIGMTKKEAVETISRDYAKNNIQIILSPAIIKNKSDEIVYVDANKIEGLSVEKMDVWQLRFDRAETNVLALRFHDNKLMEMVRYRRAFIP